MKKELLAMAAAISALTVLVVALKSIYPGASSPPKSSPSTTSDRLSFGEEILAKKEVEDSANSTEFVALKQKGVEAFAKEDYAQAVQQFEQALKIYQNAPETLIYLNNARIGNQKSYAIAASVPVDEYPNALAMLRGIAQAQKEVNEAGGINGIPLKVVIIDDDNKGEIAKELASRLAKNEPEVLGVIGHFSSGTTLAAKEIYDAEKLVAISCSSTAVDLSKTDYVFRTVPSDAYTAEELARYMLEDLKQTRVAVFLDSQSEYSKSLAREFIRKIELGDGKIVSQFDFSEPTFDATRSFQTALENQAEVLMFAAHSEVLDPTFAVIKANNGKLKLLGGDELYNIQVLKDAGDIANGMAVGVAWDIRVAPDPENADSKFTNRAVGLWKAQVNWFTAMAYDATQAYIAALQRTSTPTRESIYQALSDPTFTAPGASYPIRFTSEGDRFGKIYLLEIKPRSASDPFDSGTGYNFIPVTKPIRSSPVTND